MQRQLQQLHPMHTTRHRWKPARLVSILTAMLLASTMARPASAQVLIGMLFGGTLVAKLSSDGPSLHNRVLSGSGRIALGAYRPKPLEAS